MDPEQRADAVFERVTGGWERTLPVGRPHVAINMVSSLDGKVALGGRVRELTSDVDRALLRRLREQSDAVLVGAETVRVAGYGSLGVEPAPALAVASRSLSIPAGRKVLHDRSSPLFVLTPSAGRFADATREIHYLRGERLGPLLERLRSDHGVERIVCEGGPRLNASLFAEGLVDELFLTLAPVVAGGYETPSLVDGDGAAALEPAGQAADGDHLYLRYRVTRA